MTFRMPASPRPFWRFCGALILGAIVSGCATGIDPSKLQRMADGVPVVLAQEYRYVTSMGPSKLSYYLLKGRLLPQMQDAGGRYYVAERGVQVVIEGFYADSRLLTSFDLKGGIYLPNDVSAEPKLWTVKDAAKGFQPTTADSRNLFDPAGDSKAQAGAVPNAVLTDMVVQRTAQAPIRSVGANAVGGAIAAGIVSAMIFAGEGNIQFPDLRPAVAVPRSLFR